MNCSKFSDFFEKSRENEKTFEKIMQFQDWIKISFSIDLISLIEKNNLSFKYELCKKYNSCTFKIFSGQKKCLFILDLKISKFCKVWNGFLKNFVNLGNNYHHYLFNYAFCTCVQNLKTTWPLEKSNGQFLHLNKA